MNDLQYIAHDLYIVCKLDDVTYLRLQASAHSYWYKFSKEGWMLCDEPQWKILETAVTEKQKEAQQNNSPTGVLNS